MRPLALAALVASLVVQASTTRTRFAGRRLRCRGG